MDDTLTKFFDPAAITPWDLLFAVVTVLAGWIASNFAKKALLVVLGRLRGLSPGNRLLMARIVKYAIILVAVGVGLSFLGASVQPLLAMALIVGVVAVLALRGISTNFAAGVLLQTRQPIHVGEEIECDGYIGTVQELNARSVVIITRDGRTVHIPNSYLLDLPLVNHTESGRGRSEVEIRVVVDADRVAVIRDELTVATAELADVLDSVPVTSSAILLAEDRATLRIRFWHDPGNRVAARSAVVATLATVLRGHGLVYATTSELPDAPLTRPPAA